jgi:hypothetical protein
MRLRASATPMPVVVRRIAPFVGARSVVTTGVTT